MRSEVGMQVLATQPCSPFGRCMGEKNSNKEEEGKGVILN